MLTEILDRVWTPTVLYALFAYAIWSARFINEKICLGLLAASTVYYASLVFKAVKHDRLIHRLGNRAPVKRTYYPFGLGLLFEAVWYFSHHRNHEFWWGFFGKYKSYTVESEVLGGRLVFTADEENIKAILATQFRDYGKGEQFQKEWNDFLGLSIFTTDGERWHHSRSLLRPQFIKDRVSDLHTFENHVQHLLPLLKGSHDGSIVRADDLFFRFTLDAATDFLLGKSVDSLLTGQSEFAEAFAIVQNTQGTIARAGPMRWMIPMKRFYQSLDIMNRFVGEYIDRALALSQDELEKVSKSDEGYTFLHALASYTRERAVLRDQIIAVLLAGRDTTAVTLSWLFYELSKNPEIVKKLRKEVGDSVGWERLPTYDDLKSMRYLQHTLNETLRLYPVVPYNVRVALKDTTLPRGGGPDGTEPIGIAKGEYTSSTIDFSRDADQKLDTPIGYSTFIMQRRPEIYPDASTGFPDYLEFVPERWDNWTPKSWTYIPFNGGPRICIGQQFALTEMAYTVVRILQTFDRLECKQYEHPGFRSDIVLQPNSGVSMVFHQGAA